MNTGQNLQSAPKADCYSQLACFSLKDTLSPLLSVCLSNHRRPRGSCQLPPISVSTTHSIVTSSRTCTRQIERGNRYVKNGKGSRSHFGGIHSVALAHAEDRAATGMAGGELQMRKLIAQQRGGNLGFLP